MRTDRLLIRLAMVPLLVATATTAYARMIRLDVELSGMRGGGPATESVSVWISERRVRIEASTLGEQRPPHVLIYRGDRDHFYSLDSGAKAYLVVNRELISAFGGRMQAARREVDGQMARLPNDQRRALELLLGVRESESKPMVEQPLRFGAKSGTDRVSGFTCKKRDVFRAERKVAVICVVAWDSIGIYDDDLDVFRQLANFQRELMGARDLTPLEIVPNQPLDVLVQFDGFPLYMKTIREGVLRSEIRVVKARHFMKTDKSLFEVPDDWERRGAFEFIMGTMSTPTAPSQP